MGEAVTWPRRLGRKARLTKEKAGRRTRHKVGRGLREQVPAGKNDHGDSEEAD